MGVEYSFVRQLPWQTHCLVATGDSPSVDYRGGAPVVQASEIVLVTKPPVCEDTRQLILIKDPPNCG
jgi:hypothetical protein